MFNIPFEKQEVIAFKPLASNTADVGRLVERAAFHYKLSKYSLFKILEQEQILVAHDDITSSAGKYIIINGGKSY